VKVKQTEGGRRGIRRKHERERGQGAEGGHGEATSTMVMATMSVKVTRGIGQ
jgi:hypothetical protein